MESKGRIESILETQILDLSSFGFEPFYLSQLVLPKLPEIEIKEKVRLGHRVEKIVSDLIKASTNYNIRYENLQIKEGNQTIGEIDFILEESPIARISTALARKCFPCPQTKSSYFLFFQKEFYTFNLLS